MISEVVMPQMGADMTEGTLLRWLKSEGDAVARGEVIAEIETDKANVEIEAFEGGVFRKALAHEGDVVKVGEVIAVIADANEDVSRYERAGAGASSASAAGAGAPSRAAEATKTAQPQPAVAAAQPAPQTTPVAAGGNGRLRASPLARRIAEERGIDLRGIQGSGPGGRIVRRDVETAVPQTAAAGAPAPPAAAKGDERVAQSRMRQRIAARMAQSKREAPHYYLLLDIDMTEALALRSRINEALGEHARVSINDMIVRAAALSLRKQPAFNATFDGDTLVRHAAQHVCIGIALDDGLIAPALLDAGEKTLAQIAEASRDLIARARGGSLRAEELTAGTFTITNLGAYGVETLIGIIQPPQTAILGVGAVAQQPAVRDGSVVVREMMKVALSADHRATDGAQGAQFLAEIKRFLEQPVLLLL
jgi:pyruvate dehydrogenase E2 component (dihydrolipoamide acetyltransferase)